MQHNLWQVHAHTTHQGQLQCKAAKQQAGNCNKAVLSIVRWLLGQSGIWGLHDESEAQLHACASLVYAICLVYLWLPAQWCHGHLEQPGQ